MDEGFDVTFDRGFKWDLDIQLHNPKSHYSFVSGSSSSRTSIPSCVWYDTLQYGLHSTLDFELCRVTPQDF